MSDPRHNAAPSPSGEGDFDLRDIFAQLIARAPWIIFVGLVGAVIGAFVGQLPTTIFQAKSVVQIEQRTDRIPLPSELIGDLMLGPSGARAPGSGLATEVHIIRSRLVLEPVVTDLRQQTIVQPKIVPVVGEFLRRRHFPQVETMLGNLLGPRFVRWGETITLNLDDLPLVYVGASLLIQVKDNTSFDIVMPGGIVLTGVVGRPIALPAGGVVTVTSLRAGAGREFVVLQEAMRDSVARLANGLRIEERGTSGIVDFSYQGSDGADVVAVINAVVAEYINQNLRRRSVEIDQSIEFIQSQLLDVSAELREANEVLATYRQNRQFTELTASTQEVLRSAVELEAQLEEVAFQKEQLLKFLTTNHPDFLALEAEEGHLKARLEEEKERLSLVPEVEQELARLVQRAERAQTLEQQLVARVEQLRVLRASAVGNIRILEPAETAQIIGPDRRLPILVGLVLGLFLSGAMVLLINVLRRGIEDAREIEALGLPLFATIGKENRLVGARSEARNYGLALEDPSSLAVESLRGLRTGLKFAMASSNSSVLMITSCAPDDGKSFIALNLAIVAAKAGSKVLLIDADLRRGVLRRFFGLERTQRGLSDMLTGTSENYIIRHDASGLDFLPTGRMPPNPSELLEGDVFSEALKTLSSHYDLVIVDAPPALLVADPVIIGQKVGMSMLVVRHLVTSVSDIQTVQKSLATAGVRLSGAIMNQYDERRSRYGRYGRKNGYYYGGYRYKYSQEDPRE